ncbi:hypothetical protein [Nocardioides sp. SYSU DS0663]|uniref:hypothetical protein n=1 Tax=Nocardioides sp. SYSU DS0663 TaxID=3416445 RepID=UPI003F4B364F
MDGNDRGKDAPSLEPPSLFGRKRRRGRAEEPAPEAPVPAAEAPPEEPPSPPEERPVPVQEDTVPLQRRPAPVEKHTVPLAEPTGARPLHAPDPEPPAFAAEVPVEEDPATVAAAEEPMTVTEGRSSRWRRTPREETTRDQAHRPPRERPVRAARVVSNVNGMVAAALTGLVVGLGTVLLTWASLGVCEVATGTTSCGDPGFFLLVAVLVAMTLAGSALLRLFDVPDAGSTSFLAVGLLTVLILLFLVESLFSWAMVVVIPLLAVGTYVLSHWVTTAVAEED